MEGGRKGWRKEKWEKKHTRNCARERESARERGGESESKGASKKER